MFDARKKWPLGLSAADEPLFFRVVFLIFVAALLADGPVTRGVAALPDAIRAPFYYITRLGNSDWILIPTLIVTIVGFVAGRFVLKDVKKIQALTVTSISAFIFVGVAGPGIIANLIKRLIGRSRPVNFDVNGTFTFDPVFNDWSYQSFPSGDATTIFALAAVIMFFLPKLKWWALAGAVLVGLSRIMVGVHFPSDVFGGLLLGTFGAFAVRNIYLWRGWIFREKSPGVIVSDLKWANGQED